MTAPLAPVSPPEPVPANPLAALAAKTRDAAARPSTSSDATGAQAVTPVTPARMVDVGPGPAEVAAIKAAGKIPFTPRFVVQAAGLAGRAIDTTGDIAGDVLHGVGQEANNAVENTVQTGHTVVDGERRFFNYLGGHFTGDSQMGDKVVGQDFMDFWHEADQHSADPVTKVVPDSWMQSVQPSWWGGNLVSEIARYGSGFLFLRGAGLAEGAGLASKLVQTSVAIQALSYSANEARLSNLIQAHPSLANPVTEFLQADPSDNFAVAKMKQMLEGVSLDLGAETLTGLVGLRMQRNAMAGMHEEAIRMDARRADALAKGIAAEPPPAATVQVIDGKPVVQVELPNRPAPAPLSAEQQLAATQAELRSAQRALQTDPLTGLGSERAWQAARGAAEADPNTSILTFDLNNFKGFQDVNGHSAGDDMLRRLGAVIQSVTNRGFRPHGDEFNVIVPKEQAASMRQSIEDLFGEHPFTSPDGQTYHLSVSGASGTNFDAADAALGAAKAARKAATGGVAPRSGTSFQIPATDPADARATATVLNYEAKMAQAPRGVLSEGNVADVRAAAREAATQNDPEAANRILDGWIGNLNLNHFQTDAETNGLFQGIYKVFHEEFQAARGPVSHAETNAQATALLDGVTEADATTLAERWSQQSLAVVPAAQATRFLLGAQALNVAKLAAHADLNPSNAAAYDALARGLGFLNRTQLALTNTTSALGRGLNILGTEVTGHELNIAGETVRAGDQAAIDAARTAGASATVSSESAAAGVYANMTQGQIRGLARLIRFAQDRPAVMTQLLKTQQQIALHAGDQTALAGLVRLRTNLLLSGPKTHLTNMISNAVTAVQIPLEQWWSGAKFGASGASIRGQQTLVGLVTEAPESFRIARRSLASGANILDADGLITGAALPRQSNSFLSTVFQTPTRLLMAEDEFFKALNYRSYVRANSIARSMEDGIVDHTAIAARLNEDMNAAFARSGQALDPAALDYAKTATFTGRFETTLAKDAEKLMAHPMSRLFIPFFRTPANIFKHAWERTPGLNLFNQSVLRDLEAGGPAAAKRLAQVDMANAFGQQVMAGVLSGQITGRGPLNPALRAQWMNAGNQPYSIRASDGAQVSYRRLDPLMMHVGLIADLVQTSGEYGAEDFGKLASAGIGSLVSAVSSKTFLQGLVQTADLFGSGADGDTWAKYLRGMATSTVVPATVSQLDPDNHLREVRDLYDSFLDKTPGLSATLEPRRNFFGEPIIAPPGSYTNRTINPFVRMSADTKDPVLQQLVDLGKAIQMPTRWGDQAHRVDMADRTQWSEDWSRLSAKTKAERLISGQLPQSPFDRMMELLGDPIQVDGKSQTLRQAMTSLLQSPEWAQMGQGTSAYPGGQRYEAAQRVIAGFTEAAKQKMLAEFPLLRTAIIREKQNALLARSTSNPDSAIRANNAMLDSVTAGLQGNRTTGSAQANDIINQLLNPYGNQQ